MSGMVSKERVVTLRWRNGRLEMLDQRELLGRLEYRSYDSALSVAEGISSMVVRGAPAIGCAAAYGVALEALRLVSESPTTFCKALNQGIEVLAASRPTAENFFWALARMRKAWVGVGVAAPEHVAVRLLQEAHEILAEDIRITRVMGDFGAELLKDGARVLTHCNAGALATAGCGTALGVIRSAKEQGKRFPFIADEMRLFLQRARLTGWLGDGAGEHSCHA